MILGHLTSLLSTLLPFWTGIITVGKWKWWRKKKLALVKFKFWLFINGDEIHRPMKIIFSLKNTSLQYLINIFEMKHIVPVCYEYTYFISTWKWLTVLCMRQKKVKQILDCFAIKSHTWMEIWLISHEVNRNRTYLLQNPPIWCSQPTFTVFWI